MPPTLNDIVDRVLLPDAELTPFMQGTDLAARAQALLAQQKLSWEMLRGGYASLDSVQTRTFELDGFRMDLQFNPGRIRSSGAKVDAKSIAERPCFLCNLPPEQRGLDFEGSYVILCNPFPIFREHFTIPSKAHRPQRVSDVFSSMLRLSRELGRLYTVFYNGPKCGASAPDHLHLQAGEKGFMPIEGEYESLKRQATTLVSTAELRVFAFDGPRTMVSLESDDEQSLARAFTRFMNTLGKIVPAEEEPKVNVLASWEADHWRVIIFPRAAHRPSFFFAEGDERLMLSPASVDIGGACVTPMESDFHRVTGQHLDQMLREVCLQGDAFERLKDALARTIAK